MGRATGMLVAVMMSACGGDEAPSCAAALTHYYEAGCRYYDLSTTPSTEIPRNEMVTRCQQTAIEAPARCQDDLDDWLECNNAVPAGSTTNEQCDCSTEFMALLRCE